MENLVLRRPVEETNSEDAKRFLVMRALARHQECDEEALLESIDATLPEVEQILTTMTCRNEVEVSPARLSLGKRNATFTLTSDGWREYVKTLGSIYELPE